jgi:hypothetical protein
MLALKPKYRTFTLFIRCENCLRETMRDLNVPPGDDAPSDADELIDSGFLNNLSFCCGHCDSAIGRLVGVNVGEWK